MGSVRRNIKELFNKHGIESRAFSLRLNDTVRSRASDVYEDGLQVKTVFCLSCGTCCPAQCIIQSRGSGSVEWVITYGRRVVILIPMDPAVLEY